MEAHVDGKHMTDPPEMPVDERICRLQRAGCGESVEWILLGGVRTRGRWIPRTQRIEVTWQYLAGRHWHRSRSSIRLYTPAQLSAIFRSAGLTVDTICDWKGKPFTRASLRLIFVGHTTP
jgi:hypothetical protein